MGHHVVDDRGVFPVGVGGRTVREADDVALVGVEGVCGKSAALTGLVWAKGHRNLRRLSAGSLEPGPRLSESRARR